MKNNNFSKLVLLSLSPFIIATEASATKLNAQPLPSEKDFDNAQEVSVPNSRYHRRPDYREAEAKSKEDALKKAQDLKDAQLKAREDALKAYQDKLNNYKKQLEMAKNFNHDAILHGKSGNFEDAIALHEKACQYDPTNKQYKINLSAARTVYGQKLIGQKNLGAAISQLRKALYVAPDNAMAESLLNEALSKASYDPTDSETRVKLGDKLISVGDNDEAYVEYQAAVKLGSAKACVKIGDLYYRSSQVATAQSWYRQALTLDSKCSDAYRNIGMLYLAAKDTNNASSYLRKAVIYNQNDSIASQALIEIWRKQVASGENSCDNHIGLAGAYQLAHDFTSAKAEYTRAYQLDPNNPNLQLGINSLNKAIGIDQAKKYELAAKSLYSQGLYKEALVQMTQAVNLCPTDSHYQLLLGQCFEANGDYQSAHRAYLASVLSDPQHSSEAAARLKKMENPTKTVANNADSQVNSQTNTGLANANFATTNVANGGVNTSDTSNINASGNYANMPKNLYEGNGETNTSNGKNPIANEGKNELNDITTLRQALEQNMQNPDLHYRLALCLKENNQISEALSEFRIASALSPNNSKYSQDLAVTLKQYHQDLAKAGN